MVSDWLPPSRKLGTRKIKTSHMQGNRWAVSTENSWTKSVAYFHNYSSGVDYCEDCFHIHVFIRSSNICLSYIHSSRASLSTPRWTISSNYVCATSEPANRDVLKKQYLPPLALVSLCFSFRMTQPNFFFSHFEVNVSFPSAHKRAWLDCYWERVLFFQKPVKPTCEARRERRVNSSRIAQTVALASQVFPQSYSLFLQSQREHMQTSPKRVHVKWRESGKEQK